MSGQFQIAALLQRCFLDNLRNPSLARAKIAQKFFMGLFVGLLYFGTNAESVVGVMNLNGALFYIVGELTYATLFGKYRLKYFTFSNFFYAAL